MTLYRDRPIASWANSQNPDTIDREWEGYLQQEEQEGEDAVGDWPAVAMVNVQQPQENWDDLPSNWMELFHVWRGGPAEPDGNLQGPVVALMIDGWSEVLRGSVVNIALHAGAPIFWRSISPSADRHESQMLACVKVSTGDSKTD